MPAKNKATNNYLKNIANERRTNIIGPRPIMSCNRISEKRFRCLLVNINSVEFVENSTRGQKRCLAIYGPKTPAIKAPPIIIAKCDTSCEVITLPLSRASWSFLGVASSVFCD